MANVSVVEQLCCLSLCTANTHLLRTGMSDDREADDGEDDNNEQGDNSSRDDS